MSMQSVIVTARLTGGMPPFSQIREAFTRANPELRYAKFRPIVCCEDVPAGERDERFSCLTLKPRVGTYSTEEVLERMKYEGVRPARAEELVEFFLTNHDKLGKRDIIALGSIARIPQRSFAGVACTEDARTGLVTHVGLVCDDDGWDAAKHKFLVVLK